MRSRDGGAKVAQLATDNLHHNINADDAELLHSDDVAQMLRATAGRKFSSSGTPTLEMPRIGGGLPLFPTNRKRTSSGTGGIDGSVEVQAHPT